MQITKVHPNHGDPAGNIPVYITIQGTDLDEETLGFLTVKFGRGEATDVDVTDWDDENSTGTVVATTPPGNGTVDIVVTTPGGTETAKKEKAFTYGIVAPGKRAGKARKGARKARKRAGEAGASASKAEHVGPEGEQATEK